MLFGPGKSVQFDCNLCLHIFCFISFIHTCLSGWIMLQILCKSSHLYCAISVFSVWYEANFSRKNESNFYNKMYMERRFLGNSCWCGLLIITVELWALPLGWALWLVIVRGAPIYGIAACNYAFLLYRCRALWNVVIATFLWEGFIKTWKFIVRIVCNAMQRSIEQHEQTIS